MKKLLLSLLMLLAVIGVQAQRKKKPVAAEPELPKITLEEALRTYDFPAAERWLSHEIAMLKKDKQPTELQEERLLWLRRAQSKLNAVERVTFIDSLIVPRNEVLAHIHLSPECGSLYRSSDYFKKADSLDCTVFKSELGDQIFYAQANATGCTHLYTCNLFGDQSTSEVTLLRGISDNEECQNYPFVMTDGTTIYFAAKTSEGLGGYDIFMSRYDADEHRFLAPENIGMPFNSPANDYLYIIDDFSNLGWFVTDRGTDKEHVCIYIFIPNETRQVYLSEEMDAQKLRELARIACIRDTQTDEMAVRSGLYRLSETNKGQEASTKADFNFIVTGTQVHHRKEDFRNPNARQEIESWIKNRTELDKVRKTLVRLRASYHTGTSTQREQLKPEILMLEQSEEQLVRYIRQQEKNIRKDELGL